MSRSEVNPAFLVYAADELADAISMTHEQLGMFTRLRALAWREHGIPSSHAEIARLLGLTPKVFAKNATIVLGAFREQGGRLVLPVYEEQRSRQLEKREKARAAINARWHPSDTDVLRPNDQRPDTDVLRPKYPAVVVAVADAGAATQTDAVSPPDTDETKSDATTAVSRRFLEQHALSSAQLDHLLAKSANPELWIAELRSSLLGKKGHVHATAAQLTEAIQAFVDKGFAENDPQIKHFRGFVRTATSPNFENGRRSFAKRKGPPQVYDYSNPTKPEDIKWAK